ncbi:type VII secretion target [Cellulomonas soli]|uniref:PE domain-containing protein n=1 Tax=Cellulomonas soli TaxID=931535 RepID=A0A512PIR5_9CELL|nr:type VII secretion target [Cellulomonas soli]NYI58836.1 uncharacterized protein YukE [Cellulomonas soli]GEP71077.1 hypothetical protein CSO01_37920 [Cellulomonas soli]
MTQVRVELDALRRAASEHQAIADSYAAVESQRLAADLPRGSLGKLPQADEVQAAFDARYQGLGEALAALQEIYRNIGDGLVATADGYATGDDSVSALLTQLQARL